MIKIEIVGEHPPAELDRTVRFNFRRYWGSDRTQTAFLAGQKGGSNVYSAEQFPVKIDGQTKKFYVRKASVEALGFELVIENLQ